MNTTLTMAVANSAVPPPIRDYILRDTKTTGLGLRVYASGAKSWIFQQKLNSKPVRLALGPVPGMLLESKFNPATGETVKGARQLAEEAAALIRQGLDPRLEKKKQLLKTKDDISKNGLTVKKAWDVYVEDKKSLPVKMPRPRTVDDWSQAESKLQLSPIWKKPFLDLTGQDLKQEIIRLTSSITSSSATKGGMTQASGIMRNLRAAYRYVAVKLSLKTDDPFKQLNILMPSWQKTHARNRRICETEGSMQAWWQAVDKLRSRDRRDSAAIADWLQLSVFFGTRKTELLSLEWANVDLKNNIILLPEEVTKGHRAHVIPMTEHVLTIINRRHQENIKRDHIRRDGTHVGKSAWVFQASRRGAVTGAITHIVSPSKSIIQIIESTGIKFSPHDLRRTFATLLNEDGASHITIENALNHAPDSVAAKSYVNNPRILNLRKVFQSLEDSILEEAGVKKVKPQTVEVSLADYELLLKLKEQRLS